jgi:hypothetical protein
MLSMRRKSSQRFVRVGRELMVGYNLLLLLEGILVMHHCKLVELLSVNF